MVAKWLERLAVIAKGLGSIPASSDTVAKWLERLAVIAKGLGSIPASSDTEESEGRQIKQC